MIEPGIDIAVAVPRIARERGTAYVLMGRLCARRGLRRLSPPALPAQLVNLRPGVDLRSVADRSHLQEPESP